MTRLPAGIFVTAALVLMACTENVTPLDLNGPATSVSIIGGNNQTGPAGEPLPQPLHVYVTDAVGRAVPAQEILWTAAQGTVSAPVDSTDDAGGSAVIWTLGPEEGLQEVTATATGVGSVTFEATATAPGPVPGLRLTRKVSR
jgi:hypothetical protein